MEDTERGLAIIGLLSGLLAGVWSICQGSWLYYEPENSCLKSFVINRTWNQSRAACKREGGDLVQIWDRAQNQVVLDLLEIPALVYWIGINVRDGDGILKYLNGTKMVLKRKGLKWPQSPNQVVGCMSISRELGWETLNCSARLGYVCGVDSKEEDWQKVKSDNLTVRERRAPISTATAQDTLCPSEGSCICYKQDWYRISSQDKFVILLLKSNETNSGATIVCAKLGGFPIKVDNVTRAEIKQWTDPSKTYWIGLEVCEEGWCWADKTLLNSSEYHNWDGPAVDAPNLQKCVYVTGDPEAYWKVSDCDERRYVICEAKSPCSSRPSLIVDGSQPLEGTVELLIVNKQHVDIKCFLAGYPLLVSEVHLKCEASDGLLQETGSREKVVIKHLCLQISMHMKSCVCQANYGDRTQESSKVIINLKTAPRFTHDNYNNESYKVQENVEFSTFVGVIANPPPSNVTLIMDDNELLRHTDFEFGVDADREDLHFKIRLSLNKTHVQGSYLLIIDNGMDYPLEYSFDIKGVIKETTDNSVYKLFRTLFILMLAVSISRLTLLLIFLLTIEAHIRFVPLSFEVDHPHAEPEKKQKMTNLYEMVYLKCVLGSLPALQFRELKA